MVTEQVTTTPNFNLRAYQGGFFHVVVTPEQTGGSLSVIDMTASPGAEPPRHVHTREDETFYIIAGQVHFQVGDDVIIAGPGQTVFAPRNVPHQFTILSEKARMMTIMTPGDFINYFLAWSQPIAWNQPTSVASTPVQVPKGPPSAELMAQWTKLLDERYGVYFV